MYSEELREKIAYEIEYWLDANNKPAYLLARRLNLTPDYVSRMKNRVTVPDAVISHTATVFGIDVVLRDIPTVSQVLDLRRAGEAVEVTEDTENAQ